MATFQTIAQLTNGSQLALNATDNIWLTGTTYATAVIVGQYQDGTHVSDVNNNQRDLTASVNNIKYLTATTVSINGGGSTNLSALPSGTASFIFQFTNASAVATTGATFFAYDGVTATNVYPGITFQAAEASVTSTWVAANGSASALTLQNQGSSTTHNFYIALSATPTSTGAKAGSVQLQLTYA